MLAKGRCRQIDRRRLEQIASQTWKYFDELVTNDTNYLVPDNVQLYPQRVIAYRTSPTNMGLYDLSILSASDFGFITPISAVQKLYDSFWSIPNK